MGAGTQVTKIAYIKSSVCVQLPICDDVVVQYSYSAEHKQIVNTDCSGRGLCLWNMTHGNICSCDDGYYLLHQGRTQRCCKIGDSKEQCMSSQLEKMKKAGGDGKNKGTSTIPQGGTSPSLVNGSQATVKNAFKHGFNAGAKFNAAQGVLQRTETKTKQSATRRRRRRRRSKGRLGEAAAGKDTKELSTKVEQSRKWNANSPPKTRSGVADFLITNRQKVKGPELVSLRCEGLAIEPCAQKGGCEWRDIRGVPKCADRVGWQCAATKRISDCKTTGAYTPSDFPAVGDQACGQLIYKQTKLPMQKCTYGARHAMQCLVDTDCPWPTHSEIDALYLKAHAPTSKPEKDRVDELKTNPHHTERFYNIKTNTRCQAKDLKDPDCRRFAECATFLRRIGCHGQAVQECEKSGAEKIPTMAV